MHSQDDDDCRCHYHNIDNNDNGPSGCFVIMNSPVEAIVSVAFSDLSFTAHNPVAYMGSTVGGHQNIRLVARNGRV